MKNIQALFITSSLLFFSITSFSGTPMTTIECKSQKNNASFTGTPGGEYFDLKIKIDNSEIRYTDYCDNIECKKTDNYGNIVMVDALFNKVFTISLANNENNNRGIFYALPNN